MKKRLSVLLVLILINPLISFAAHSVTLNWTASADGGVVTVYRANGACSTTSIFTAVTTGVTGNTYTDATVTINDYCYQVTAVVNTKESAPSNQVTVRVLPSPPTSLVGNPQ